MALNIKNPEVQRLAAEVARLANETKTEAIRRALAERQARLVSGTGRGVKRTSLRTYLERNVWPLIPATKLGQTVSREEQEQILG